MAPVATATSQHTSTTSQMSQKDGDTNKLYKDAYSHGYTEGYISGHGQADELKKSSIAITGMSCRLPGNVSTPDEFWELLSRARRYAVEF